MRERLLDDDVGCAVAVNIQSLYYQGGIVGLEGEVSIPPAREMKLYGPDAARRLRPAIIDKNRAVGLVIAVKIGSGNRLKE